MNDPKFSRPWWRQFGFRLFARIARPPRGRWSHLPANPRRILVLAPVLRGDYIVMSPLIAGLARARPRAEIAVLVTKPSYDLALADPLARQVLLYRKLPGWFRSIWEIIRYRPDIVVMPKGHPAFTESLLMALTRAPYRVGLSHPFHDSLLTHPVAHNWDREHRTVAYARLLEPFGLDPATVSRRLHIGRDPKAEAWVERTVGPTLEGRPQFSLNLSAGSETRWWPTDSWRTLIRALLDYRPEARFVAISAPGERAICETLAAEFDEVQTVPTASMLEATAIVARCDLLISADTGTVQAAAARGVPIVVLYNGDHENYVRFSPQSVPHRAVLAARGKPVSTLDASEVAHQVIHLLVELEQS